MRFGKDNEYGPGDNVVLSVADAAGFLDKLEPVVEPQAEPQPPATGSEQPTAGNEQPPATGSEQPAAGNEQPPATGSEQPAAGNEQPPADWHGLDAKVVASLEAAGVTPAMAPTLTDEDLTAIDGIGTATLKKIRSAFGNPG